MCCPLACVLISELIFAVSSEADRAHSNGRIGRQPKAGFKYWAFWVVFLRAATTESPDKEWTYALLEGNVIIVGTKRFPCPEVFQFHRWGGQRNPQQTSARNYTPTSRCRGKEQSPCGGLRLPGLAALLCRILHSLPFPQSPQWSQGERVQFPNSRKVGCFDQKGVPESQLFFFFEELQNLENKHKRFQEIRKHGCKCHVFDHRCGRHIFVHWF